MSSESQKPLGVDLRAEWIVPDVATVKISEHGGVAFSTCCPNHWLVCTAAEARKFAKALKKAANRSCEDNDG